MLPGEENAKTDSQSGIYEAHYKIRPGDIVVDLGANVGYWTEVALCRQAELVIAVEPFVQNFVLLKARVANWSNVICVNAAAGEIYGERDLYEHPLNCGAHSLFPTDLHHQKLRSLVPAINIGHFLSLFRRYPDFIKIDTEGAEIEIVASLIKHKMHNCHIAVECHDSHCYGMVKVLLEPSHDFSPETEHIGVCYADPK